MYPDISFLRSFPDLVEKPFVVAFSGAIKKIDWPVFGLSGQRFDAGNERCDADATRDPDLALPVRREAEPAIRPFHCHQVSCVYRSRQGFSVIPQRLYEASSTF
jgi:hypothetical protein